VIAPTPPLWWDGFITGFLWGIVLAFCGFITFMAFFLKSGKRR
jgi:hypothetical protein